MFPRILEILSRSALDFLIGLGIDLGGAPAGGGERGLGRGSEIRSGKGFGRRSAKGLGGVWEAVQDGVGAVWAGGPRGLGLVVGDGL